MKNPNIIQPEDLRISQIIDANLDRAREGLRVLEDWARFGLGNEDFVIRIKNKFLYEKPKHNSTGRFTNISNY